VSTLGIIKSDEFSGPPTSAHKKSAIIGIGASAGGIDALQRFFPAVAADTQHIFVVVQHLAPTYKSKLTDLLSRFCSLPVLAVDRDMSVEPGHVYVIPPNAILTIKDGRLHLTKPAASREHRTPIDSFFVSLAIDQEENAACVILSGTGSDGTLGLRAIKEHGGLTLAQTSESAEYDGMMRSAISTGLVDFVLPAEDIPAKLAEYFSHSSLIKRSLMGESASQAAPHQLAELFSLMNARTGHNFSGYKDKTVIRRVQRRMQMLKIEDVEQFIAHSRKDPHELDLLFRDLLIGVTNFFRDTPAFAALEREVIPKLFEDVNPDGGIRVWVPGCSTGEEAYSIAILLLEQRARANSTVKLQIFASDINEDALELARTGRFPASIAQDISPARLKRYFSREENTYRVTSDLREICLFSPHNLLRDPPFSKLDLISCRNLMIYLDADLQSRIIPLFHYALRGSGYLFLGSSESVTKHHRLFSALDKSQRIFMREQRSERRQIDFPLSPGQPRALKPAAKSPVSGGLMALAERQMLDRYAPAFVVINADGEVLQTSARTGKYLELPVGAPDTNVFGLARRGLRAELRDVVRKSIVKRETIVRHNVQVGGENGSQIITLTVQPLQIEGSLDALYMVIFQDVGGIEHSNESSSAAADLDGARQKIEADLRATRERLQNTGEELESSNEELKSANEELSSINEELQSSNEELESSKEELQSTNEELHTVNAELNNRVDELGRINDDIRNLLENTQIATVFLDRELNVKSFTPTAKEVFRLIESDLGRPLSHVRARFKHPGLQEDLEKVLQSLGTIERYVQGNESAALYVVRMLPYRTVDNVIAGVVLTFTDITRISAAEAKIDELTLQLRDRVESLQTVLELLPVGVIIANKSAPDELRVNRYVADFLGSSTEVIRAPQSLRLFAEGRELSFEDHPLQRAARLAGRAPIFDGQLLREDGSFAHVRICATSLFDKDGKTRGAVASVVDLTEEDEHGAALLDMQRQSHELLRALPVAVYTTDASGSIEYVNEAAVRLWGRRPEITKDRWSGSHRMFWPDGRPMPQDASPMSMVLKEGREFKGLELIVERPDGSKVACLSYPTVLRDSQGKCIGGVDAIVDISERKHADDIRVLLMDELNHRVKNTLATVQSIAARSLRSVGDAAHRDAFDSRLVALSRTHDLLAEGLWERASLRLLLTQELEPYSSAEGTSFTLQGPDFGLNPKAALALGMSFHELATNAAKYGALSWPTGCVRVEWQAQSVANPRTLSVSWTETGGPVVKERTHRGFGSVLIERGLSLELNGEVQMHFHPTGLVCTILMPLLAVEEL
jgi:two-component system CheB/CheR fusion protein